MTTAIITAIVIVVIAGVALFIFFRSRSVKPNASVSKSVSSIGSGTPFQTRKAIPWRLPGRTRARTARCSTVFVRATAIFVLMAGIFGSLRPSCGA
ncbi:MAG: hypothetical protein ACLTQI_03470 [Slackia sp.]